MTLKKGYQESVNKVAERTKYWQTRKLGESRNAGLRQLPRQSYKESRKNFL